MTAGIVGGYGGFAAIAGRYLYPSRTGEVMWQFVSEVAGIEVGQAIRYRGPSGETINITRMGRDGGSEDFIALSSTCPHLGCQVRWEAQNDRFFCPCHNGVFDPSGVATAGPPGEAGQSLPRYELEGRPMACCTSRFLRRSSPVRETSRCRWRASSRTKSRSPGLAMTRASDAGTAGGRPDGPSTLVR